MNIRMFVAAFMLLTVICCAILLGGPLAMFFDIPSIMLVLGALIGASLWSFPPQQIINAFHDALTGNLKDEKRAIQNHAVLSKMADISISSGLLGTIIGLIMMLQNLDDPTAIGPAMAVSLLTLFYGILLGELFLRSMANNCLAEQDIVLERSHRRGFTSVYLGVFALFILMSTFFIMMFAMAAFTHTQ